MDSLFSRICLVALVLLLGTGSPAWAEFPLCEESAETLWQFRQEVAVWTANGGLSAVDGAFIPNLPEQCVIEPGQPINVAQHREWLLPWSTNLSAMETSDGVQTLWSLDTLLIDQIAGGMAVSQELEAWLGDAITERRRQFDAAEALSFPLSQTESVPLGTVIKELPVYRQRIQHEWRALDADQQDQVRAGIVELKRGITELLTEEGMIFLGPLRWDTVLDSDLLPPPVGEENIALYVEFLELYATYIARLQRLEALNAAAPGAAATPPALVDQATVESLRMSTDATRFREPLQIPPIAVTDNSWLLNWLSALMQRFTPNTQLGAGLRWLGILLSAALLGWIAYLLVGSSDPWGNRAIRFQRGDGHDVVVRGRNLSPAAQFQLALEAARAGRHQEAWHWLTQGFILGLAQSELVKLDWSRTNREVLRDLHHKRVAFLEPATNFFRTAEGVVYGGRSTSVAEIEQFERTLSTTLASLPKKPK